MTANLRPQNALANQIQFAMNPTMHQKGNSGDKMATQGNAPFQNSFEGVPELSFESGNHMLPITRNIMDG